MARFPALLLIVLIGATSVTSVSLHFRTHLGPVSEEDKANQDEDIGVRTKLEKMLLEKLEEFREKMKSPQPNLNLPTLDPFSPGDIDVNINRVDQIEVFGNLTNVVVEGLSSFKLTWLKIYIAQTKAVVRLTMPQLQIKNYYDLNGTLTVMGIPAYGKGNAKLTLHNVRLEALPYLSIVDGHLAISKLNLNWNHAAWLEVSVDGLYCTSGELSAVVSHIFSDLTPRLLRNYKTVLLKYTNDILFREINALLAKLSLKDIIDLLPNKSLDVFMKSHPITP